MISDISEAKRQILSARICFTDFSEFSDFYCRHCLKEIPHDEEMRICHSRVCPAVARIDKSFKYICLWCSYHTYRNAHMKNHFRGHTGEKPFMCPVCKNLFRRKSYLQTHLTKVHLINSVDDLPIPDLIYTG